MYQTCRCKNTQFNNIISDKVIYVGKQKVTDNTCIKCVSKYTAKKGSWGFPARSTHEAVTIGKKQFGDKP
jgi:hypothetical protein